MPSVPMYPVDAAAVDYSEIDGSIASPIVLYRIAPSLPI